MRELPPVRRAKFFLGKRDGSDAHKRLRNSFLGKRDAREDFIDYLKRTRPFLGRRARPFLGKRSSDVGKLFILDKYDI